MNQTWGLLSQTRLVSQVGCHDSCGDTSGTSQSVDAQCDPWRERPGTGWYSMVLGLWVKSSLLGKSHPFVLCPCGTMWVCIVKCLVTRYHLRRPFFFRGAKFFFIFVTCTIGSFALLTLGFSCCLACLAQMSSSRVRKAERQECRNAEWRRQEWKEGTEGKEK